MKTPNLIEVTNNKLLRGYVLLICAQTGEQGATARLIDLGLQAEGLTALSTNISNALFYLTDEGFITRREVKAFSRTVITYHITAKGIDLIEKTAHSEGVAFDE